MSIEIITISALILIFIVSLRFTIVTIMDIRKSKLRRNELPQGRDLAARQEVDALYKSIQEKFKDTIKLCSNLKREGPDESV